MPRYVTALARATEQATLPPPGSQPALPTDWPAGASSARRQHGATAARRQVTTAGAVRPQILARFPAAGSIPPEKPVRLSTGSGSWRREGDSTLGRSSGSLLGMNGPGARTGFRVGRRCCRGARAAPGQGACLGATTISRWRKPLPCVPWRGPPACVV